MSAQVDDLRAGDVVEMTYDKYPGVVTRGPLRRGRERLLCLGDVPVANLDGNVVWNGFHRTLTVVSRAPRSPYVNHPRTEPAPGDVVRDADSDDRRTWTRNVNNFSYEWHANLANVYVPREKLPDRLRLLVDGETGQVVP